MSTSLNQLEIALLTKLAISPKPTKSWADYKRSQRQRAAARTPDGKMLVTADNIQRALIDAIADAVKSGTPDLTVTDIIQTASQRFPVPIIAESAIRIRLAARKPVQSQGGPEHV